MIKKLINTILVVLTLSLLVSCFGCLAKTSSALTMEAPPLPIPEIVPQSPSELPFMRGNTVLGKSKARIKKILDSDIQKAREGNSCKVPLIEEDEDTGEVQITQIAGQQLDYSFNHPEAIWLAERKICLLNNIAVSEKIVVRWTANNQLFINDNSTVDFELIRKVFWGEYKENQYKLDRLLENYKGPKHEI